MSIPTYLLTSHVLTLCKVNFTLTTVELSGCALSSQGILHLSNALKVNHTVLKLGLQENGIGNHGAAAMADCLLVNMVMRYRPDALTYCSL